MMSKVYILNGEVINIGEWNYGVKEITGDDLDNPILNDSGDIVGYQQTVIDRVITNPLPAGAVESEIEVIEKDGGFFAADDYKNLRRAEYPKISDQLDALWKGGADAENMKAMIMGVKNKYPKI